MKTVIEMWGVYDRVTSELLKTNSDFLPVIKSRKAAREYAKPRDGVVRRVKVTVQDA